MRSSLLNLPVCEVALEATAGTPYIFNALPLLDVVKVAFLWGDLGKPAAFGLAARDGPFNWGEEEAKPSKEEVEVPARSSIDLRDLPCNMVWKWARCAGVLIELLVVVIGRR